MAMYHHHFQREATPVPSVYFHDLSNTDQSLRAPDTLITPFRLIYGPSIDFTETDYSHHLKEFFDLTQDYALVLDWICLW